MSGGDDRDRIRRLREAARERWDGGDAGVDALAAALSADGAEERAEAAWALAELAADADDPPRLPVESALAPALDDDDRWVRRGASWALALVADARPGHARAAADAVVAALTDDDPLVRENAVLALGAVAAEYPYAVESALSKLADLADEGEGLTRRYAAETLHRLVAELDASGFPETVVTTRETAALLPEDAGVVAVTDEGDEADEPIRVRSDDEDDDDDDEDAESDSSAPEDRASKADPAERGPPDLIPSPPAVTADRRAFERLADLGGNPLTAAEKVRAPADGDHVVATLRTLRADAAADPDAVATGFRAWDRIADHDHVAPVLARGDDPRPWVATEFADGGTLRDAVGEASLDRALWYAHCVAKAVCHAHARGVVHGALRPGAVGLSRTLGAWPVPKVADWGLGEAYAAVASPPVPPAFAAPEHLAPERFGAPDHATDVYLLGALTYSLVAGRPPFAGDARDPGERDPDPASASASDVPPAIENLLTRALAADKHARFESAEDFRRELEVVLAERD